VQFKRVLIFLVALVVIVSCSGDAAIKGKQSLSWMHFNEQEKTVLFELMAGWNGSNNAYNYNGFYDGNVTLKVPAGWLVEVVLTNQDSVPHNIIVTLPFEKEVIPSSVNLDAAVLERAYTEDVYQGEKDTMKFIATQGHYWFFCGINGHGVNGMWIKFDVDSEIELPAVIIP